MTKPKDEQVYDLRTLEQVIREGAIDPKDYQSYLKTIPDCASNADYLEVYEEPEISEDTTVPEGGLTFRPAETTK